MMKAKKALVIGCGAFALIAILVVAGLLLFVNHVSKDLEGVALTVNGPTDVAIGQTFDLEIVVKNERSGKVLRLSDVDIADEYLAGFTVSTVKPRPKSNTHVPIDNSRSFTFDVSIPPGTSQSFIYTLRAEKAGMYRGDVDVCEGMQFITGMAQTVVKEKQ
jgi:hypothetical protein